MQPASPGLPVCTSQTVKGVSERPLLCDVVQRERKAQEARRRRIDALVRQFAALLLARIGRNLTCPEPEPGAALALPWRMQVFYMYAYAWHRLQ